MRQRETPTSKRPNSSSADAAQRVVAVEDAVREYLENRKAEGDDVERDALQLEAHVLPRWGRQRIVELEAAALKAWRNELAATPPRRRTSCRASVPRHASVDFADAEVRRRRRSTVNRIMTVFKAALNYAADLYPADFPDRAAWRLGLRAFRNVDRARERWLTRTEAAALLAACAPDFRRLVQAALYTGCRYSELCRAQVGDYRAQTRTLRIPRSKSGKWREVVLHREAAEFFATLCKRRRPEEPLLVRGDGARWDRGQQVRPMREACRRAGLDSPVTFNGLRHSYASLAVQSGMTLIALARNLGHADTRMVERHYGHLSDSYMRRQIERHAPTFRPRKRNR